MLKPILKLSLIVLALVNIEPMASIPPSLDHSNIHTGGDVKFAKFNNFQIRINLKLYLFSIEIVGFAFAEG